MHEGFLDGSFEIKMKMLIFLYPTCLYTIIHSSSGTSTGVIDTEIPVPAEQYDFTALCPFHLVDNFHFRVSE